MNPLTEMLAIPGRITKDEISQVAEQVKAQVDAGNLNPLDVYLRIKVLSQLAETLTKELQAQATDEAQKHGPGEHTIQGIKVKVGETGTRYKFDHIPAWVEACKVRDEEMASYNENIKDIEEAAKARMLNAKILAVDENTGEEIPAAIKESKTSLIVTIPKK